MNKTYYYSKTIQATAIEEKVTLPKLDYIKVQNIGDQACQIEFDNDIDDTESIWLSASGGGYDNHTWNFAPEYINTKTAALGATTLLITGVKSVKAEPIKAEPIK